MLGALGITFLRISICMHKTSSTASVPGSKSLQGQTLAALVTLKTVWKDKNIAVKYKLKLLRALAISVCMYVCMQYESRTLTAELHRRMLAVEIKCYRRIIGVCYIDHNSNDETITQYVGHYKDQMITVKRRNLRWHGYLT